MELDAAIDVMHPAWPGRLAVALWTKPNLVPGLYDRLKPTGVEAMAVLHALRRRIELSARLCSRGFAVTELRHDLRDLAHLD